MGIEEDDERWRAASHAMQSGVAMEMNLPDRQSATEPKHLRVGINAAMSDHAGLVKLLVDKGLITNEEYMKAIADQMEIEKADYEARLSAHFGKKITLA